MSGLKYRPEEDVPPSDSLLKEDANNATISEASVLNDPEDGLPELESEEERRMRKKSHLVIYTTIFIMSIGFSIVLTGVWPYLKRLDPSASKEFLGWVVAANPMGQMIAAPFLGWLANRVGNNRGAMMVTLTTFIIGNIAYALLPLFKVNAKYVMIVSRFIIGISSANIAVCRSYIATSTKISERTTAISITAAAQSLGFILGPSIQTVMVYIYQKEETSAVVDSFDNTTFVSRESRAEDPLPLLNMYASAAWFVAFLGVLNLFLFLPYVYKECHISLKEAKMRALNNGGLDDFKIDYLAIGTIIVSFFSMLLVYVLLETIIVPMCLDMYAWTPEFAMKAAGIGLTITGAVSLIMFISAGKLANLFNDRVIYFGLGLVPLTLSILIFFPLGNTYPKIKYCHEPSLHSSFGNESSFVFDINELDINSTTVLSSDAVGFTECKDLGCPSTQKWCFDTPIIEIPQFIAGCVLTTVGYPVAVSLSNAIYSKLIGPTAQGLWMGALTSAGSLSRIIGPIFVTYMYTSEGPLWTFVSVFILLVLIVLLNGCVYKRLKPMSLDNIPKRSSLTVDL